MSSHDGRDPRAAILARRRRFIIAALSGVTAVAMGCESEVETVSGQGGQGGAGGPRACLDYAPGGAPGVGGAGADGGGGFGGGAGARPCLEAPAGGEGGVGGTGGA